MIHLVQIWDPARPGLNLGIHWQPEAGKLQILHTPPPTNLLDLLWRKALSTSGVGLLGRISAVVHTSSCVNVQQGVSETQPFHTMFWLHRRMQRVSAAEVMMLCSERPACFQQTNHHNYRVSCLNYMNAPGWNKLAHDVVTAPNRPNLKQEKHCFFIYLFESTNHSLWRAAEPVYKEHKKASMQRSWSVRMNMTYWVENRKKFRIKKRGDKSGGRWAWCLENRINSPFLMKNRA